jgi:ribosome recycling factor
MIPKSKDIEEKMKKSVEAVQRQFMNIKAGKASPSMFENIKVEYYGTLMNINQVASINIPEPKVVEIDPWDKSLLKEIEKAIQKSEIGLTPINDGKIIRIILPSLTEERRKEIIKMAKKISEDGKIAIRNIRRESNEILEKAKENKEISEDEVKKMKEQIQKITDKYIQEIDKIFLAKEKEIMEV